MAEKEILQQGTVPTVNSRGVRTGERAMRPDEASGTMLSGLAGKAEAALRGRGARLADEEAKAMAGQHGQADRAPFNWTK